MADVYDLVERLLNDLEHHTRRMHFDATGNHNFETCNATMCTQRRALFDEARTAIARNEVEHG